MATVTRNQGKTRFVKEFLNGHPEGNTKDVNVAWRAAGCDGMISPTLVNKTRVKMRLPGNPRGRSRRAATGKVAPNVPKTTAPATLGKTSFVKEFLNENAQGNVKAVNEAWAAAGMKGTISPTLVNKTRAMMGLSGNLRGKSKAGTAAQSTTTGKGRGRPPKEITATVNGANGGQPRGRKSARTLALLGVEAEIDGLIFQIMGIGNLIAIETALREARRLVYGALSS